MGDTMIIIDGTNLILGRLATHAAKQALLGEEVVVINCDNAIVSGEKEKIYAHYRQKVARGTPRKGVFFSRSPDRVVRRTIRGMLPHKQPKGKAAFGRVTCYRGVPEELAGKPVEQLQYANMSKLPNLKYTTVVQISKQIGAKG